MYTTPNDPFKIVSLCIEGSDVTGLVVLNLEMTDNDVCLGARHGDLLAKMST